MSPLYFNQRTIPVIHFVHFRSVILLRISSSSSVHLLLNLLRYGDLCRNNSNKKTMEIAFFKKINCFFTESQVNSLSDNGIYTIEQLWNDSIPMKLPQKKIASSSKAQKDNLTFVYDFYNRLPSIPSADSSCSSVFELAKDAVTEFGNRLEQWSEMFYITDSENRRRKNLVTIWRLMFGEIYLQKSYSIDEIGIALECTRENARILSNKLMNMILACRDECLSQRQPDMRICRFSSSFLERISELDQEIGAAVTLAEFRRRIGFKRVPEEYGKKLTNIEKFILNMTGKHLTLFNHYSDYVEPFIVRFNNLRKLNSCITDLIPFFRKHVFDVNEYDLKIEITKLYGRDEELRNAATSIVEKSEVFETEIRNGVKYYMMTWKNLSFLQPRVIRILHDWHGKEVSKEALFAEYNRRAAACGDKACADISKFNIKRDRQLIPVGKSGNWKLRQEDGKDNNDMDVRRFLYKFLSEHNGIARLSDIMSAARENGFHYEEGTIKTYLNAISRHSKNSTTYYLKAIADSHGIRSRYMA